MRTIAVLNQKGGVGKTTTVVNTAAGLAALGAKVIVIDLDPQAHLTIHLGIEPQSIDSGSYKVLTQSARLESEVMMVRENLWLLPANIDLVGAESELVSVVGREIILREALEESQNNYDYCLIDCAPSLGLLTLNALAAAQEVLIPLQPHFLALQGFGKLLQTVEIVNRRINPGLKVNGILLCMFDSRASLPNEVKADIERFLNDARGTTSAWAQAHVLPVLVRRNIKLAEAPSYGQTIFEYEKACHGAEDYQKVAEFIHAQTLKSRQPEQSEVIPESAEQPEQVQSDMQTDEYTEQVQESEIQSEDIQENMNESFPEASQDSTVEQRQDEFASQSEEIQNQEQQNQQEYYPAESAESIQNDTQPEYSQQVQDNLQETDNVQEDLNSLEQLETQPELASETPQKPPIEIREIQSQNSQEHEYYTEISKELNQPDQTDKNNESNSQGI
jgi:chromosome partitioning protein